MLERKRKIEEEKLEKERIKKEKKVLSLLKTFFLVFLKLILYDSIQVVYNLHRCSLDIIYSYLKQKHVLAANIMDKVFRSAH